MKNIHAEVTAKILAQLKAGVAPWRKPWSEVKAAQGGVMPRNAATGRPYSGVNILLLWSAAQAAGWGPRWLTFKQAKEAGGSVKKGEKGEIVVFVKKALVEDRDNPGQKKSVAFLRYYHVFNTAQCEGLPGKLTGEIEPPAPVDRNQRDDMLEAFVGATGIAVVEEGARAFYSPVDDKVRMPSLQSFKSSDAYYSTLFHELGHGTGHESRLNRNLKNRFGDRAYAAEELIAELTSAFVCAEWGIDMGEAPAAYIDNWVSLLEQRETAIVTAAAGASRAVDWLRGAAGAEEADDDESLPLAA